MFAGYVASRMGLPVDRLVVATNVNDILVRTLATGAYEMRGVVATSSPSMDIQVSSNFERLLFDACGPRRRGDPRHDGIARAIAALRDAAAARCRRCATCSRADRASEDEVAATIRTTLRETGHFIDPHTAVGVAVAEKESRDPALPMIVLSTAHAGEIPRCGRGRLRHAARPCRTGCPISKADQETCHGPAAGSGARSNVLSLRRAVPRVEVLQHECRTDPSSVRSHRRDRCHVASGIRLARRLGRLRQPRRTAERARRLASSRTYGVQGHDAAHRAADRGGDRSRRRRPQCRDRRWRPPPIMRACSRPTCRSRSTCSPTSSPTRPSIRPSSSASRT